MARPAEETGAEFRIPANVVPPAHLILEESRQQEALGAGGFHHHGVVEQRRINHEVIEDVAEVRRGRKIDRGLRRYLSVVSQHTGVVEEFPSIDAGSRDILQVLEEEFQRLPMIARKKLSQWTHSARLRGMARSTGTARPTGLARRT